MVDSVVAVVVLGLVDVMVAAAAMVVEAITVVAEATVAIHMEPRAATVVVATVEATVAATTAVIKRVLHMSSFMLANVT